jgi:hypothetical protein
VLLLRLWDLSSGYDLSALECTFVADREIKLWHITAVILILDLMQFRLIIRWTHLTWQVLLVFFYSITAKGIDLSEIVTGVISFFTNLVNKSSVTPFKKVHKIMGNQQEKDV